MTPTGQSGSRPITPAERELLKRHASNTQQAMDNLLGASPHCAAGCRITTVPRQPTRCPHGNRPKPVTVLRGKTGWFIIVPTGKGRTAAGSVSPTRFRKGRANVGYETNPGSQTALPRASWFRPGPSAASERT